MNELVRLLVELSEDPFRREEFLNNPGAVLDTADLSQEEREVLLTRDPQKILEFLGYPKGSFLCVLIALLVGVPRPPEKPPEEPPHGGGPKADKEKSSL